MKMTKIRPTCLRLEHNGRWGLVEYNGSEWLAQVAFYQKTGSRGPIVKPKSKRMPRYRRVGFYPTEREATDALCRVLDRNYVDAMRGVPVTVSPRFIKRFATAKLNKKLYGLG